MTAMADRILILGASARAAAASARRAGLVPFAVDLFADADTERICEKVWRCSLDRYPDGLFELARRAPPMPWMYTGGLENYPDLVGALARERDLWGNGPDVLAKVRDPGSLRSILGDAYPRFVRYGEPPPVEGQWVRKPLRGAGGLGVRFAAEADPDAILQAHVFGKPMSAVFAANGRLCACLSVTAQLTGARWLHTDGFLWAGNIDLPDGNAACRAALSRIGQRLMRAGGVRGLFGVDFVLGPDGTPTVTEVNPRYPGSAELTEHGVMWSVAEWHRWGCGVAPEPTLVTTGPVRVVGKAIYYAPHRLTVPASGPWDDSLARAADVWHRPDFADLPHPGDRIEPGQPVLTILADAATEAECLARLQSRAADLDRLFGYIPENDRCPP